MTIDGFQKVPLGDIATFRNGKAIKPGEEGVYPAFGSNGRIGASEEALHDSGVIIGRVGAYCGSIQYSAGPFWASDNTIVAKPRKEKVSEKYLSYLLKSLDLNRHAGGSAQPLLTQSVLKDLTVSIPRLEVQQDIVSILSSFDDLVSNNSRRIEILEEIAKAIYREWFVNFRFPGHEDAEMVESKLGPIPEDWEVRPFEDLADLVKDSIRPTNHPGEEFDYYSFGAFDDGRRPEVERGEQIKSNKYLVHGGCVLLSKLNPRIPRVWRPPIDGQRRPITSTEFLVLIAGDRSSRSHLFELCRSTDFLERFKSLAGGTSTSHQRVKPDDLLQLPVVVPPRSLVREFTDCTSAIHALVDNLRERRDVLGEIRNLLLPKLVSGAIDVSELDIDTGDLPAWQESA